MYRRITQVIGTLFGNGYLSGLISHSFYQGALKGGCVPFLNCYACPLAVFSCPIGTLQHFMTIRVFPLMLIGFLGVVGVLFGRLTCGWLCPFGFFQDLLYKIPSDKIWIPRFMTYFKYVTLIGLVIILPFITGVTWFSNLCPAGTLTAAIPWLIINPSNPFNGSHLINTADLGALFLIKLMILGAFVVLFVMSKRPFCRTTCPLGAIFSLFHRFRFLKLEVSTGCRQCGRCRITCPVDHCIGEESQSKECILCLNCTSCKHVSLVMPSLTPLPKLNDFGKS